jgi:putative oxidoreductase
MDSARSGRAFALLIARLLLGLIFFMAGVWKVFVLGPVAHAHKWFVDPYAASFLPRWSLWATGTSIPFVELVAGALLLLGWRTREALLALGAVLVLVTFGHLLAAPLYEFHTHVIPRAALLLFILMVDPTCDRFGVDGWLARRSSP